jgi:4-amino-4-deoxy-L-arabinose transferase-like glycosyltransferase
MDGAEAEHARVAETDADGPRGVPDPEPRGNPRWYGPALVAIGLLGLAVRWQHIASVTSHYTSTGDPYFFYYWPGVQLARGYGLIDPLMSGYFHHAIPSAAHPPGLPLLIAGLFELGIRTATGMRYALAVLGAVTVVLMGVLAGRVVSRRAGIIAALLAAVYPNVWITDTLIMSETLMMFGIAIALLGVYDAHRRKTWVGIVWASIGLTIAASARPENLFLFIVVVLPLVLARRSLSVRHRLKLVGLAAVAPLLAFVPWTLYNASRFERPVLMSTGFGQTLLAGSCDQVFTGPMAGLWTPECLFDVSDAERAKATSERVTFRMAYRSKGWQAISAGAAHPNAVPPPPKLDGPKPTKAQYRDQSVENGVYVDATLDYLKHHKSQLPKVVFIREARTLELWKPNQEVQLAVLEGRGSTRLVTWTQRAFWVMCILGIAGAVLWRKRKIILYPLYTQMVMVAVVVGMTFGSTRYRAPAELCLVLLAATAIDVCIGWAWRRFGRGPAEHRRAVVRADDPVRSAEDAQPLVGG